ncbi:hypothetical protein MMC14_005003 [Varicellaria rhodocarpa]|nr:hypothetical protein [Varicellaria rhodocarpa]
MFTAMTCPMLPFEVRARTLHYLLSSENGGIIEDPAYNCYVPDSIYAPVLRLDIHSHLEGLSQLYGSNMFKFSSAYALEAFLGQVNIYRATSALLRSMTLEINVFDQNTGGWIGFLKGGNFKKLFPKVKLLNLEFPSFRNNLAGMDVSPLSGIDAELRNALKISVSAQKVRVTGVYGDGADAICDDLERSTRWPPSTKPIREEDKEMKLWLEENKALWEQESGTEEEAEDEGDSWEKQWESYDNESIQEDKDVEQYW